MELLGPPTEPPVLHPLHRHEAGAVMDEEEHESVLGYMKTHWDCPACGLDHEEEGDKSGETVTCDGCGEVVRIREVV